MAVTSSVRVHFALSAAITAAVEGPPLALCSLIWIGLFSLRIFIYSIAIGQSLPFQEALMLGPLVLVFQMLPLSIGGFGMRESLLAFLFWSMKYLPEAGATIGFLIYLEVIQAGIAGWAIETYTRVKVPADRINGERGN